MKDQFFCTEHVSQMKFIRLFWSSFVFMYIGYSHRKMPPEEPCVSENVTTIREKNNSLCFRDIRGRGKGNITKINSFSHRNK